MANQICAPGEFVVGVLNGQIVCADPADPPACTDLDGDHFCTDSGATDCDDTDPAIHPGATEITTNGKDDDCDGQVDEAAVDNDADGFNSNVDCNDSNAAIHPGATEIENSIDDDCDGQVDEGFDLDADGFSVSGGDCDDANAAINPAATEIVGNGVDEDCDGQAE
jgi:hypothetical protein